MEYNMSWFASAQTTPYFLTTADLNDVMLNGVLEAPLLSDPPRSVSLMSASVTHTPSPLPPPPQQPQLPPATHLPVTHQLAAAAAAAGGPAGPMGTLVQSVSAVSAAAGMGAAASPAQAVCDDSGACVTLVEGSGLVSAVGSAELTAAISAHELSDWAYQDYVGYESDMKQEQMDFDPEDDIGACGDGRRKMSQSISKKPKVHLDPKLKLKGPITYEKDVDPSVIPIARDGMARCKKCGAIGVRHAFYTRERKYCSLRCARSVEGVASTFDDDAAALADPAGGDAELMSGHDEVAAGGGGFDGDSPPPVDADDASGFSDQSPGSCGTSESSSGAPHPPPAPAESEPPCSQQLQQQYSWDAAMRHDSGFQAAPVPCFAHAPLARSWYSVCVGMKVEVPNCVGDSGAAAAAAAADGSVAYWVAFVLRIEGYRALVRYEGSEPDLSAAGGGVEDFWVDLCSDEVHPVGWSALQGRPLIPPAQLLLALKPFDWNQLLMKRLTGARTLPSNFHHKVLRALGSQLREGQVLEVVDKCCMAQVRPAVVSQVIGRRLHVHYLDAPGGDSGFWCHENSPLVHPVGWALSVGHRIAACSDYLLRCQTGNYLPNDATQDYLPTPPPVTHEGFKVGMMLEAVDPLNLSVISVATVQHVLASHYLMLRFETHPPLQTAVQSAAAAAAAGVPSCGGGGGGGDGGEGAVVTGDGLEAADGAAISDDCFCYHASSPLLFPPGFAQMAGLPLQAPHGYQAAGGAGGAGGAGAVFSWEVYVRQLMMGGDARRHSVQLAPAHLFHRQPLNHGFQVGHRLEAVDLMDPQLVCVATVVAVCGRLLRVHFDGWHEQFDQWLDAASADLFPCGWCRLVGYRLEPPRPEAPTPAAAAAKRALSAAQSAVAPGRRRHSRRSRTTKVTRAAVITGSAATAAECSPAPVVSVTPPPTTPPDAIILQQQQQQQQLQQQQAIPDTVASATRVDIIYSPSTQSHHQQQQQQLELQQQQHSATPAASSVEPTTTSSGSNSSTNSSSSSVSVSGPVVAGDTGADSWSVQQVCHFLAANQCAGYCDSFARAGVDGRRLLALSRHELLQLAGGKVGPSLKIDNLLDKLRARAAPAAARQRHRAAATVKQQ